MAPLRSSVLKNWTKCSAELFKENADLSVWMMEGLELSPHYIVIAVHFSVK